MVTDYGDITDQSFNQTTWEAVVALGKDNNVETKYYKPTSNDTAGRVASVELAIAEGYNVIVMPGYAFGGTIVEVAPNYPDVKFVALDVAKGDLLETAVANKGESYDYNPDNWESWRLWTCVCTAAIYREGWPVAQRLCYQAGATQAGLPGRHGRSRRYPLWLWLCAGR